MTVEVVAMVYKSVEYLEFIARQLQNHSPYPWRILANDADPGLVKYIELWEGEGNFTIHDNPDPDELYINRQYRGFNACVETSDADLVVLLNSDHALHDLTIDALVWSWNENRIPVSRLVEREYHGHVHAFEEVDFGTPITGFKESKWLRYAADHRSNNNEILPGGMFMPVAFHRERFIEAGMYPPGNIGHDGEIAEIIHADKIASYGDAWFFEKLERDYGMEHVTVCDSLCYHVYEGEKRDV